MHKAYIFPSYIMKMWLPTLMRVFLFVVTPHLDLDCSNCCYLICSQINFLDWLIDWLITNLPFLIIFNTNENTKFLFLICLILHRIEKVDLPTSEHSLAYILMISKINFLMHLIYFPGGLLRKQIAEWITRLKMKFTQPPDNNRHKTKLHGLGV